jgi:signal transduction histidine kinase
MREVSCRIFPFLFRGLQRKGVALDAMVEGTSVALATLENKHERIDWADFCAVMANVRKHFTDAEYVALGRSYFRSPGLRFAFVVARLLLTPMGFYRWLNKPRAGAGNQMFSCIEPTHRDVSDTECEVDLVLPEGFEICWDFYLITVGNFEEMPRLLGYPPAKVTLERIPQGGRFRIEVSLRAPLLTRLRRALTWPFTIRAAAKELQEAHETLQDRYNQLEDARTKLARQATRLRTAHTINELIHGDLALSRLLETIARVLVEQAGFAYAEIELYGRAAGRASYGEGDRSRAAIRQLASRGSTPIATLVVVTAPDANAAERQDLIDFLAPALSMALQNALDYHALEEYRSGLERLVDERTAELRQARDQLTGTVMQLEEAQGARERFFGNISHEIRTPLSLILLAVADVEARTGHVLDPRAKAGLASVAEAARKLVRLVDELLLLAAGQEGKLQIRPEPIDLAALMTNLVSAWLPAADAAGLRVTSEIPATLVARVDPVAFERVASNLVSNAVKYSPADTTVRVELAQEHGIRLSVLDEGDGIPEELAGRLFGRFERGADRRKAGTGIGLSLVKQLVEAHGGTVSALRRESGGTELRVLLPEQLLATNAAGAAAALALDVERPVALVSGQVFAPPGVALGTIVLAEDDSALAEALARRLGETYKVVVALDGEAALEAIEKHQPQLLVTDVDMPKLNGIELSRRFREMSADKLAPIVILSAVLDVGTRIAGLEAGALDYVTKPIDPIELDARVRAQFRMRDLSMRLHRAEQLSALGVLTSGLAHELRNPANGIVNAVEPLAQLLPTELRNPETPTGQLLEVMKECSRHIAHLSRQLLGFKNGGAKLDLQPAHTRDLVERAASLARAALHGIDLRISGGALDQDVMCAPPLLVQVLTNLIENAGHAAGKGGWVEVNAGKGDGAVTIEVADSGPGVPRELRERVFEPFFTTKAPGSGTGLGLSVARSIIHRHHGVLEIRERADRAVFVIELPARAS